MTLRLHPKWIAVATFLLGMALAGIATIQQARHNQAEASQRLESLSRKVAAQVAARMQIYEYALRGVRGAFLAAGAQLDRQRFHAYSASRDIDREFPGARGFGVIRRVAAVDQPTFVSAARGDGWPDFTVRQFAPHAGERYLIQYIEPVDRNAVAIGLDIASESNRRGAAEASMRSGAATLTAPITLVQATGRPARSFLLMLPIYRSGASVGTEAEREAAAIGWAYAPLIIDDVLKGLDGADGQFNLSLRDLAGADTRTFFSSPGGESLAAAGLSRQIALPIFGRTWAAEVQATPTFMRQINLVDPRLIACAGSLLAALLAALTYLLALGAQRLREVGVEQARRSAIIEGSADAIIGETLDGIVTDWNAGAERLFGYPAATAVGRLAASLLLPAGREAEDADIRAAVARGERVAPFDTTRLRSDGTLIDVSVTASPIMAADRRCTGFSKTVRDISEARRAQQALGELNADLERQVAERTSMLDAARHTLQTILDAMPSQIGYWDRNLVNQVANRAYQTWFGIDPAALRGKHIREVLGEHVYELNRPHLEAALAGEAQTFRGSPVARPDEQGLRHALVNYLPDVVDGEVRGVYTLVHDVSELVEGRLKLAAALRDNEALQRTFDRHMIVSIADRSGRIIEVNDNFCRISGYSREELAGQTHRIVNSGTHDRDFWIDMWRTIASGQSWRAEVCNRAKDGSLYWVDNIIAPFVGDDGRIEKFISIRTDITARKRAESALVHERHLMSALLESLPDQIYFKDEQHRFLRINPGLARRYGLGDPAEAIGKSDGDFFTAEHARCTAAVEREIMDSGTPVLNLEEQEFWPDRPPTWNLTTKMALRDPQGCVIGTFGISRDITARKRMEEELQRVNDRFSIAAGAADMGVWESDVVAGTLDWDERMFQLYGRSRADGEASYSLWVGSLHAEDRERCEAEVAQGLSGARQFDTEFRIVRPDGEVRYIKAAARVLRDEHGRALRMTGVNLDVTTQRVAQTELLQTSTLLEAVLAAASQVSIVAVRPDGLISVFNSGAERLLGYRCDEVVGRETSLLFHDRDQMRARAQALSAQLGRKVPTGLALVDPAVLGEPHEWSYRRKDGSCVPVSLTVTAMRDGKDELFGYLGIAHDVSRQKEQEQSLRAAMQKARHANRAKSQFLANMSHEIRTPMNAVIGLSYLLERTPLTEEQAALLAKIKLASKSLLRIINDILDLSKIEAAELKIERMPFDLSTLLHELSEMMKTQADAKGIRFAIEAPEGLPCALDGDATRLYQILTNLLANAIKFTERGRVHLNVSQVSAKPGTVRLRFVVQDTGIGIEPEALTRVFAPFAQADASTTRRFGGTGLGLSIVEQLTNLMGGAVGVSSTPQVGSEFWVELDFAISASAAPPAPQAIAATTRGGGLPDTRVLVADDSAINLEVAKRILELEGAKVWLASNGQEAVDLLSTLPQGFDVVLMDMQMPVLDGHDATQRIRNVLGLSHLPIIALTAGALATEQRRAEEAGVNDFVSKPFDPQALVRCIRRHVRIVDSAVVETAPAPVFSVTQGWPEIAGIDTRDACMRLGGDVRLFRSMLKRMLAEFADIGRRYTLDAGPWDDIAAWLHNLKGSAGTIGAKSIERIAGEAETACRANLRDRVEHLIQRLAEQLGELRHRAACELEANEESALGADHLPAANLDPQELAGLVQLLRQCDLAAVNRFTALSPQLRQLLGRQSYALALEQIDNLQFGDAAKLLEELHR